MRRRMFLIVPVVALTLVSLGGQFSPRIVHAAQTWNVAVGTDGSQLPGGSLTTIGFWPGIITINAGDTVSWTFPSVEPHGVAFEAGQMVPFAFQLGPGPNAGDVDFSAPFLPQNLDKLNGVFQPGLPFASGVPTDPPDQRQPFTLTFNTPGVFAYDCQIHGPFMAGTIVVLPATAALSETPAQASTRGQADLAAALGGAAAALGPEAPPIGGTPVTAGGASIVLAAAGVQPGANVAALAFFPAAITVHRGDTVVFAMSDPQEIHTVTFLSGGAPPPFVDVIPNPTGPPQIVFPAKVALPSGGSSYTGSGFFNTGILFPGGSAAITINAPPGTYAYECLLHGDAPQNMKGTITVAP